MKPIQQRRLFFLTTATSSEDRLAKSELSWKRCFRPWGRIAAMLSAALLISCSSLTPERVNVIAAIAGQAAQVGASQWLAKHPEHKASFDAVIAALVALQKSGNTNEDAAVQLLSSLPTDALRGPDGELYVAGDGGLVVWDGQLKRSVAVRGPATVPVIKATVAGLRRATGPKPPVPPKPGAALALPPGVVAREMEGAPTNTLKGYGPANVWASNATVSNLLNPPSTFELSRNEHGIQQISVRWGHTQGIYIVQRSEDGKVWEGYASVTNAGVWTTLWPAPCAVGLWRVRR